MHVLSGSVYLCKSSFDRGFEQTANLSIITSAPNNLRISFSDARISKDENQSSSIVVRSLFFTIFTLLITRSALLLVIANETRIVYREVNNGKPDSSQKRMNFMSMLFSTVSYATLQNNESFKSKYLI